MNIAFISDVHTDFWVPAKYDGVQLEEKIKEFVDEVLKPIPADILVLAGDNSHYNKQNKIMFEYLVSLNLYKKIFVVHGNHEMYLVSNSQEKQYKTSLDKIDELKKICESIETIEFLDGNIIEVDGIKIGGTAMWYDGSYGVDVFGKTKDQMLSLWKNCMNDANLIKGKDTYMTEPPRMYEYGSFKLRTFDPWKFFETELEKMSKILDKCDIFISHIGPSVPKNLKPAYQNDATGFYYFRGEHYLHNEKAPKLWIFGHTHDQYYFKVADTELVCNPLGYKSERTGASIKIISI